MADGQFAELQESHVLVMLDTKNGKSEFCEELNVNRNASYVLLMKANSGRLMEKIRFVNPKKLETVFKLVELYVADSEQE